MIEGAKHEEVIQASSDRSFGVVFAVFFGLIGAWPLLDRAPVRLWALIPAGVFLLLALLCPRTLNGLNRLWLRLGLLLNRVVSPVALGIVFLLTVVPIGLLLRLFGKDPLRLKRDPSAASYWLPREPPGPDPKSMRQQF